MLRNPVITIRMARTITEARANANGWAVTTLETSRRLHKAGFAYVRCQAAERGKFVVELTQNGREVKL